MEKSQINVVTTVNTVISNQNHLLNKMEENQIEMKENQNVLQNNLNDVKTNHNETMAIQNKIQLKQNEMDTNVNTLIRDQSQLFHKLEENQFEIKTMHKKLNEIEANVNTLISNQNQIFSRMDDLITGQSTLMNKVNSILRWNISESLESVVLESNEILTQMELVGSATQNVKNSISTLYGQIQNVKENVAPKLYCNNRLSLDDCIEKHFDEQQNLLHFIKTAVTPEVNTTHTPKVTTITTPEVTTTTTPEVTTTTTPEVTTTTTPEVTTTMTPEVTTTMTPIVWLVGGSTKYEGRVEVNYLGRRGTVCDDHWDDRDAKVTCRMLGMSGGKALLGRGTTSHNFGAGEGEILLDSVACTGSEQSIFDCRHNGIGVHNCVHREDAGVRCNP